MGAPTSSGVLALLLGFFVLGLIVLWSDLFAGCLMTPDLYALLKDSLDLTLVLVFFGFVMSWIGGLAGLLIGGVVLFL